MLGVVGFKTEEEKRKAFMSLFPGYNSSKETPDDLMLACIDALKGCKDGTNQIVLEGEQVRIANQAGNLLFPRGAAPSAVPAPATSSGQEPY